MGRAAVKPNQPGPELVKPGKGALAAEAHLIDGCIKPPFGAALDLFARRFVFSDGGNALRVEASPAGGLGIECGIGIEVAPCNADAQAVDELTCGAQVVLQVKRSVMMTSDTAGAGQDEPVGSGQGQDLGGFGFLAALIGHRLTASLGQRMAAIQIQVMGIDWVPNLHHTLLEHPRQTPGAAPLAQVVLHRPPRNLVPRINRYLMPLATRVPTIQHVIE